jgi:hypothetical protein
MRAAESRRLRRIAERIEQRVRERDRDAGHPEVRRWQEPELIPLGDGDRLDRDELRGRRAADEGRKNGDAGGRRSGA